LDIVNASLVYFGAKNEGHEVILGSTRPAAQKVLKNIKSFAASGCIMTGESIVDMKGRYIEPTIANKMQEEILFFSRNYESKADIPRLAEAFRKAVDQFGISDIIFVDGGGDSLILESEDASHGSETNDPFKGGDAETMAAIHSLSDLKCNIYHAAISIGLDINVEGFQKNVKKLAEKGAYFGRVNMKTGEKDAYKLDHLIKFESTHKDDFFALADKVLVLGEADFNNKSKMKSHTATVTYHALKGNYGIQRTFVPWEPVTDGKPGVEVKPEHCWMYFFDARAVEQLKIDLNKKK